MTGYSRLNKASLLRALKTGGDRSHVFQHAIYLARLVALMSIALPESLLSRILSNRDGVLGSPRFANSQAPPAMTPRSPCCADLDYVRLRQHTAEETRMVVSCVLVQYFDECNEVEQRPCSRLFPDRSPPCFYCTTSEWCHAYLYVCRVLFPRTDRYCDRDERFGGDGQRQQHSFQTNSSGTARGVPTAGSTELFQAQKGRAGSFVDRCAYMLNILLRREDRPQQGDACRSAHTPSYG